MSDHGPVEKKHIAQMSALAKTIDHVLNPKKPKKTGFVLLMFDFNTSEGRMNYMSNAPRDDMLVALKELVANMEGRVPPTSETKQ